MDKPLEIGDVVHLNSGSPRLTVRTLLDGGDVAVSWISDDNEEHYMQAPPACFRRPETPREYSGDANPVTESGFR